MFKNIYSNHESNLYFERGKKYISCFGGVICCRTEMVLCLMRRAFTQSAFPQVKVKRTDEDMKNKERAMGLVMAIIISIAMGALAAFLVMKGNPEATKTTPVPVMYISNILLSVVVGIVVALVLPLGKLGRNLAEKAHAKPPAMKFTLINAIPIAVGNTLIISLIVSFFGVFMARSKAPENIVKDMPPLPVMWLANWGKLLIPTLVVSYLLSVLLTPIVAKAIGLTKR